MTQADTTQKTANIQFALRRKCGSSKSSTVRQRNRPDGKSLSGMQRLQELEYMSYPLLDDDLLGAALNEVQS